MGFSKFALQTAEHLRPLLVRIIPAGLLSKVKARVIENSARNLDISDILPFAPDKNHTGVNLIGNIQADTGLGQSMRLVADILEKSRWDYAVSLFFVPPGGSMHNHDYDRKLLEPVQTDTVQPPEEACSYPYSINLIHVNASELPLVYLQRGKKLWQERYTIAYWLWELEEFPEEWIPAIRLVNEIWTPSEFISRTLRKYTEKPVVTIPYSVTAPTEDRFDREHFGLPQDRFLYLMMFNSGSVMERKNPLSVIAAFKEAFAPDDRRVGLVIKVSGADDSEEDIRYLKEVMKGYSNLYLITGSLPKTEVNSLVKCVDVFVSLHRAEGFGLVLAEAMLNGTPTIATNWSANTEFMNPDVACMVDYRLVELDREIPPFHKGYHWAEADVHQAAAYMKKLLEDEQFYDKIKCTAVAYIRDKLSMNQSVRLVNERIAAILAAYDPHKN